MKDRKHRPSVVTDGGTVQTADAESVESMSTSGEASSETTGATSDTTTDKTRSPGNRPIQQSDPDRAIRVMYDVACEDDEDVDEDTTGYFKHYVRNTNQLDLLREYIMYESDRECRRHRIGLVNQRITQLKQEQSDDNE